MQRVIFIFIDGCGIGCRDNGNPFFLGVCSHLPFWRNHPALPDGTPVAAIDANLGVPAILELFK